VIFVDSSFWIAETLPRDTHHSVAANLAKRHSTDALTTTNLVLAETWTYIRRRAGHRRAIRWLDRLLAAPRIAVERIDPALEDDAWRWLRAHDERPYSFVDATSFALMRKLRIGEALAFDGDFAAAGFVELRPSGA
jgi:predicted nucleic acid-binding protein